MPTTQEDRLKPPPIDQRTGLGDVVHSAAQPVVMLINAFGGPDMNKCVACGQRRKDWNKKVPDVLHPFRNPLSKK
jgi:hypothetical protein